MAKKRQNPCLAALYLRSSKDRHEVSIDAQRRELTALAAERDLVIVEEFADAVESGKDENRPGLQSLLGAMKDPGRTWEHLLMVDTSRLSRQPYFAHAFAHECERRGITVVYSKVPDLDQISSVILYSVLRAMDRVHSLMSREKGLAGMAENVRRGFRAGGRAPLGYNLERLPTGTMRDGKNVTKTRLTPSNDAHAIAMYLEARAQGRTQRDAAREAGLAGVPQSTLIGCEWRALTYAGHSVWNQHSERIDGGYKGGCKHRPREEWVVEREAHPALISDATAEAILERLIENPMAERIRRGKNGASDYLLTGLLETPNHRLWTGDHKHHYRIRAVNGVPGRAVPCAQLDAAVLKTIRADLGKPARIRALLGEVARNRRDQTVDPAADLRAELARINAQLERLVDLAISADDPAPYHRRTRALEQERRKLEASISSIDREQAQHRAAGAITEDQLKRLLDELLGNLEGSSLKYALRELVERIVLDPDTLETRIHYKITPDNRLNVASPRGFEPRSPP